MALDVLDGYLTAIVSGPVTLKTSEWLPGVWGSTENDKPIFKTMVQANTESGTTVGEDRGCDVDTHIKAVQALGVIPYLAAKRKVAPYSTIFPKVKAMQSV